MRRLQGSELPGGEPKARPGNARKESTAVTESAIARMQEGGLRTPAELEAANLIYAGAPDTRATNAFRQLRTSVLRRAGHRNFLLMVTGTGDGAGSSFIAANLAAAIALDQSKTALLVDCNLRRPDLSRLAVATELDPIGLTDFLSGAVTSVKRIIHPTGIRRLRVIPVGTSVHAGSEVFTGANLRNLFSELLARYPDRYIIVDAPAVAESADARILAELCNFVMVTVPYGRVTAGQLEAAVSTIPEEHFLGTVVNDEPFWPLQG